MQNYLDLLNSLHLKNNISQDETIKINREDEDSIFKLYSFLKENDDKNIISSDAFYEALLQNKTNYIRQRLSCNKTTPAFALEYLSRSHNPDMRATVAKNLSTPVYVLEELSFDKDKDVRKACFNNPNMLRDDLETKVQKMLSSWKNRKIVGVNVLTEDMLYKMSFLKDSILKNSVAKLTKNPEILTRLSKDKDDIVRMGVARNKYTPMEILRDFCKNDVSRNVANRASNNINQRILEENKDRYFGS